jgi:pyruvate dehydrogenase kinase 2/3/4
MHNLLRSIAHRGTCYSMRSSTAMFVNNRCFYGPWQSGMQSQLNENKFEEERKLIESVNELSKQAHNTVSMKQLIFFGQDMTRQKLIEGAKWLHHNLKIRLAKQVYYLNEMPKGLNLMPSVRIVREWYYQSFSEILNATPPNSYEELVSYSKILETIYERHSPTSISVAKGAHELKRAYISSVFKSEEFVDLSSYSEIHEALNNFYINRIGMRMLIGQQLELYKQVEEMAPAGDHIGLICVNTKPKIVIKHAIEDAKEICSHYYMEVPDIRISGQGVDTSFPYVPSHLYYVVLEILKNALRATCEWYKKTDILSPIDVVIADSETNEDICIRISDQGGGIPRSHMSRIWSYLYTSAPIDLEQDLINNEAPLAGLGYGLPLSRVYCQYWGGSLNLMSMEGLGTDVYIHLNKSGDIQEPQLS